MRMIISLDNKGLVYSGRIDRTNAKRPEFIFPATSLHFRFYGKKAVITIENRGGTGWDYFAGIIADGAQKKEKLSPGGITEVVLVDEQEEGEHDILLFKRQDGCHEMVLTKLELSEGSRLLKAPEKPGRRIEVYGDSVSAGEVSEAVSYLGKEDPEHTGEYSNSWYSYAAVLARKLDAELHNISRSGIPLLNGNGWVMPPFYPGMETLWDKIHYDPETGEYTLWDFDAYVPHLVIVALGQNDSNPDDYMKEEPEGLRALYWKYKYSCFIKNIRKKYPRAVIVLTTTILEHSREWDDAVEAVCKELGDDRVFHFLYQRNGCGTPGHVRISEAEEMASELAAYVENLEIPVWE